VFIIHLRTVSIRAEGHGTYILEYYDDHDDDDDDDDDDDGDDDDDDDLCFTYKDDR
jgi:hypothetical protein